MNSPNNKLSHICALTWNCKGVYTRIEDLQVLLSQYSPDILCLQETHLKNEQNLQLRGFASIKSTPPHNATAHGGTVLAIKQELYCEFLTIQTELQITCARVSIHDHLVTICSIYLAPDEKISRNQLDSLLHQLPKPLLLLGDFNSHNPLWGGPENGQTRPAHGRVFQRP